MADLFEGIDSEEMFNMFLRGRKGMRHTATVLNRYGIRGTDVMKFMLEFQAAIMADSAERENGDD